jgi:hypothetical protein
MFPMFVSGLGRAGMARIRPSIHVVERTGPLRFLVGRSLLVLLDHENIDCGARDLGFSPRYDELARRLRRAGAACRLHAFFSCEPGDCRCSRFFEQRGWTPHAYGIQTVRSYRGVQRLANSDPLILFTAGALLSKCDADAVVVASGDGTLVCDLAAFVGRLPRRPAVVSLSLAGSTSWRLDSRRNHLIAANIEIGRDCLRPRDFARREGHLLKGET